MTDSTEVSASTQGMSNVQRTLALIIVLTFAVSLLMATGRFVTIGEAAALNDMAKTLQAAAVNMALIALGFYFGSSTSKVASDASSQKILDKLTSNPLPPSPNGNGNGAWWSKLTDAEKTAITNYATKDPRVSAFIMASTSGTAAADDLDYLVTLALLTSERAAAIKGS